MLPVPHPVELTEAAARDLKPHLAEVAEAAELRAPARPRSGRLRRRTARPGAVPRITERVRPRLEVAQARARVVDTSPLLDGLAGVPDVAEGVGPAAAAPSPSRRRSPGDRATVRARQGARVFDPESIRIDWKALG